MTRSNSKLASRLRHRVTFEQPVMTPDSAGGFMQSWNVFAEVWADVVPRSAGERFRDEQIAATKRVLVVVRYLEGITPNMRISYDGKLFNILSVLNPYEENVLLEITAEEGSGT